MSEVVDATFNIQKSLLRSFCVFLLLLLAHCLVCCFDFCVDLFSSCLLELFFIFAQSQLVILNLISSGLYSIQFSLILILY